MRTSERRFRLALYASLGLSTRRCAGVFDTNSAHAFRWMEDPMSGWMTGRQCSADDVSELLLQGDLDQRVRSVSVATTLRRYPGTCTVGPGVLKLPATVGLQLMVTSAQRAEIQRLFNSVEKQIREGRFRLPLLGEGGAL